MMIWFLILFAMYLGLLLGKAGLAVARARRDLREAVPEAGPRSFTILQAILSGDAGLTETLENNLLSMTRQIFFWLVDEDDAAALQIARDLKAKHPDCSVEIMACPPCPDGVNPKIFKLDRARGQVQTPFILVLDDDTSLPSKSADALIHHAQTSDLSTGLPCYLDSGNFPSSLLAQFVNNNSAMTYLSTLAFMEPITINGMCYAMKTGGADCFPEILHHLTDDLALATQVRNEGGGIYQSARPQFLKTEVKNAAHYVRLMHRWYLFAILLMRNQPRAKLAPIIFLHGAHPLILWGLFAIAAVHPSPAILLMLGGLLVVRSVVLHRLHRFLFHKSVHKPLASLLSELLQPLHMLHALLSRKIVWRTRRYRVLANDHFESYG